MSSPMNVRSDMTRTFFDVIPTKAGIRFARAPNVDPRFREDDDKAFAGHIVDPRVPGLGGDMTTGSFSRGDGIGAFVKDIPLRLDVIPVSLDVIPAKAGIHFARAPNMDTRFREDDDTMCPAFVNKSSGLVP
ncbi:MAG TPA: hypothetical protein VGC55_16695 [Dokdonella sp.]